MESVIVTCEESLPPCPPQAAEDEKIFRENEFLDDPQSAPVRKRPHFLKTISKTSPVFAFTDDDIRVCKGSRSDVLHSVIRVQVPSTKPGYDTRGSDVNRPHQLHLMATFVFVFLVDTQSIDAEDPASRLAEGVFSWANDRRWGDQDFSR